MRGGRAFYAVPRPGAAAEARLGRAMLALSALCFLLSAVAWRETVMRLRSAIVIDDAFILYRYAEHWAAGFGPTWNVGEAHAEGYSSPLFVALLAAGKALGADVPALAEALGIACSLSTVALLLWLTHSMTGRAAWALLAGAILLVHPSFALWAVGGMETPLYTLLLLGVVAAVHRSTTSERRRALWALSLLLSLAALARTEGVLAAAALAALAPFAPPSLGRRWLRALVPVAFVVALHVLVRRLYYGLWLPLPVYEKGDALVGWDLVWGFAADHWVYLPFVALALALGRGRAALPMRYAAVVAVALAVIVLQVDPVMGRFQRYLLPCLPGLVLLFVLGLRAAVSRLRPRMWVLASLAVAALLSGPEVVGASRDAQGVAVALYSARLHRGHVRLGQWIAARADPDTQLVVADCGVIPYYAGVRVIDVFGLNTPHVAMHGVDTDWIFSQRPELVVVSTLARDAPIRADPRLRRDYVHVATIVGLYPLALYRRRDFPIGAAPTRTVT